MSQKYKSFSKGCGQTDCNTPLPPDVKRVGYLRKLKRMKRRFFVLRMAYPAGVARLEYYSSEKKWRSGGEPRRIIELKNCLNIGRKLHSKQKNVIALYTRDDCFSVVAETPEELESWLEDLLEIQKCFVTINENKAITLFEHLWQVHIEKHDLECSHNLSGSYLVALSTKALTLIKMDPNSDFDCLEFPLMSIRRCGHSKDYFFIELGRSAVTGAGEIYMATEGTIIAQNMHETVLSAMKSSKVREDGNPPPRPRSASTSENSNPVATRRPIGVVTPQTISSTNSNALSNSRERCDSLPTRPKTLSENSSNSVFSALSSPHSSSGAFFKRGINSRPHSMYEWPSFNSPSARITSPFSLSSNGGYASSSEDVDSIKQSASFYSQTKSMDGTFTERPLAEVPDEYLMMSPSEDLHIMLYSAEGKKDVSSGYMFMKQSECIPTCHTGNLQQLDMKPSKSDILLCLAKKSDNYMAMAPGVAKEVPVVMQDGYMDMSPSSKSYLQNFNEIDCLGENKDKCLCDPGIKHDESREFVLEKVPSLISDEEKKKFETSIEKNSSLNNLEKSIHHALVLRSSIDSKSKIFDIPSIQKHAKENENLSTKPPIPERTYKNERSNVGPPIPVSRSEYKACSTALAEKGENFNCKFKYLNESCKSSLQEDQDFSQCIQVEENSVFDENEVFSKDIIPMNTNLNKISPLDQNTNFSCAAHNERKLKHFLPCASTCSANQMHFQQSIPCSEGAQNKNQPAVKSSDNVNFSCFENSSRVQKNAKVFTINQNTLAANPFSKSESYNIFLEKGGQTIHSCDDYVNLEFKTSGISNSSQNTKNSITNKNLQIPNPPIDVNYTNIQFGKPFCPTPNPTPAVSDNSSFGGSLKLEKGPKAADQNVRSIFTGGVNIFRNLDVSRECATVADKIRTVPNLLPAFRKQMSAPAGPPSLRPELPSPGRKSSCPVTASASMIKNPLIANTVAPIRPMVFLQGGTTGHLRVTTTQSPEHSSVSSISSASDEISSNHSSPKTLNVLQNFGAAKCNTVMDSQYENVVIPQRPPTSRPSSISSEKELNYASLDLAPSARDDIPRSPILQKPANAGNSESLLYAEIDFTKSEGLKNISGTFRDSRL